MTASPADSTGLRVVLAGTPVFAQTALDALLGSSHRVLGVMTQPDRPAGRGLKLTPSPVKQRALEHGLPVLQVRSLREDGAYPEDAAEARAWLDARRPDLLVVVAYGLILPPWVLNHPKRGCLNIHGSLLPRWRGAAPIHRAIEAGDAETGVAIMRMDVGLDTGPVLREAHEPIHPQDDTPALHDRLAARGAQLLVSVLDDWAADRPVPEHPQATEGLCYAHKIHKAEATIDWRQPATLIERRVRALAPSPGQHTTWRGQRLKVICSKVDSAQRPTDGLCGHILLADFDGVRVLCGDGVLCITAVQLAGGKPQSAAEFLNAHPVLPGERLGDPV